MITFSLFSLGFLAREFLEQTAAAAAAVSLPACFRGEAKWMKIISLFVLLVKVLPLVNMAAVAATAAAAAAAASKLR